MDNFQISIINVFILFLWCTIIPCFSTSIYLFASVFDQRNNLRKAAVYFIVSILLLTVVSYITIYSQSINPLCSGVGDPEQMMCIGFGLVPAKEAINIINNKIFYDLIRTTGIPTGVSIAAGVVFICARGWRKTQQKKRVL